MKPWGEVSEEARYILEVATRAATLAMHRLPWEPFDSGGSSRPRFLAVELSEPHGSGSGGRPKAE
jgi:hypothetical protein